MYRILDIEHTTDLVTDALTVLNRNALIAIDVDPQYAAMALADELNADQFVAEHLDGWFQQLL